MKWRKLNFHFQYTGTGCYGARAPVALRVNDSDLKVYFGALDHQGRSRVYSLILRLSEYPAVLDIDSDPLLNIGEFGYFHDNGISPSCVVPTSDGIYLYTIGFSRKNSIMFDAACGLAISNDGGKTFKGFQGPVLDRSISDPCFSTSPWVIYIEGRWHMWYVSGEKWLDRAPEGKIHFYNIKHRRSDDGVSWNPPATTCLSYSNEAEYAIARPTVIFDSNNRYRMWFCFRESPGVKTFRIGYAESEDGLVWRRSHVQPGLDVSTSGWDSEMICYPSVFEHKGRMYMLYNGNGYGKTGFGLAVLEGH